MRRIEGVVVGTVSQVDAGLGRVKVKFPWLEPEQESHWAPIASLLAGKKRGARFMPEIDDEVLVAFDHGHFEHPYVIGFLWNGADGAPDDDPQHRVIVTPGGHELRFEDNPEGRKVILKTSTGHELTLDDRDRSVTLKSQQGHKVELRDLEARIVVGTRSPAGGQVMLEDAGTATLGASGSVIAVGPGGIKIDSAAPLHIHSTAETKIEALGKTTITSVAALEVTSSGVMNVSATGMLSISSAGMLSLSAGGVLSVNAPVTTFSGIVSASAVQAGVISGAVYTPGPGNLI